MEITSLSFDPGFTALGWSICVWDTETKRMTVTHMETEKPGVLAGRVKYRTLAEKISKRMVAVQLLDEMFERILEEHDPDFIITESPFFNSRTPNAYESLVQWCLTLNSRLANTRQEIAHKVAPTEAKKHLAASSTGGKASKLDMMESVRTHPMINTDAVNTDDMSSHAADSVGVAYGFFVGRLDTILKEREKGLT